MKSQNLYKIINEHDWFLYIIRSLDIFSFVCNTHAYQKVKFIGGVKNFGYLYHGKLVDFYRSKKEFSKNIQLLEKNIIKHPERIMAELLIGIEYNNKAKLLLVEFKKKNMLKLT